MIAYVQRFILPAAYALLPPKMQTPEATALLLAIGLQESRFTHRRQVHGPARGFWQFEQGGGVTGVIVHHASFQHVLRAGALLGYPSLTPMTAYAAIEHNDVLAAVFARLLLYTAPGPLPDLTDAAGAWAYYLDCWRPGRPHRETWADHHTRAAALTRGTTSTGPAPLNA